MAVRTDAGLHFTSASAILGYHQIAADIFCSVSFRGCDIAVVRPYRIGRSAFRFVVTGYYDGYIIYRTVVVGIEVAEIYTIVIGQLNCFCYQFLSAYVMICRYTATGFVGAIISHLVT